MSWRLHQLYLAFVIFPQDSMCLLLRGPRAALSYGGGKEGAHNRRLWSALGAAEGRPVQSCPLPAALCHLFSLLTGWDIHASLTSIRETTAGVDLSTGFLSGGHGADVK